MQLLKFKNKLPFLIQFGFKYQVSRQYNIKIEFSFYWFRYDKSAKAIRIVNTLFRFIEILIMWFGLDYPF